MQSKTRVRSSLVGNILHLVPVILNGDRAPIQAPASEAIHGEVDAVTVSDAYAVCLIRVAPIVQRHSGCGSTTSNAPRYIELGNVSITLAHIETRADLT